MSASREPARVAASVQGIKRLPEKFTRNRYQFDQLCRTDDTAIYIQHIKGRQKAFEVVVITVADRKARQSEWTRGMGGMPALRVLSQ